MAPRVGMTSCPVRLEARLAVSQRSHSFADLLGPGGLGMGGLTDGLDDLAAAEDADLANDEVYNMDEKVSSEVAHLAAVLHLTVSRSRRSSHVCSRRKANGQTLPAAWLRTSAPASRTFCAQRWRPEHRLDSCLRNISHMQL